MSITINTKVFTAAKVNGSTVGYIGPSNSSLVTDKASMGASETKGSADYSGDNRGTFRFMRTVSLTGAKTATGDCFADVSLKLPKGMAGADVDALLNDAGAFLSSADGKTWAKTQKTLW